MNVRCPYTKTHGTKMAIGSSQMAHIIQIAANVVTLAVVEWKTSKYLQISCGHYVATYYGLKCKINGITIRSVNSFYKTSIREQYRQAINIQGV